MEGFKCLFLTFASLLSHASNWTLRETQRKSSQEIFSSTPFKHCKEFQPLKNQSKYDCLCLSKKTTVFFNLHEDVCFYIYKSYLIIIRLPSKAVGIHCQWTVTAKMPNFYIHRNKKLGRSKSSRLFPGAFLRQLQEGELKLELDRQSMLTGQLGYTLISISHSISVQMCMFIHYIFPQLSHPFRLYLLPYKF